MAVRRVERFDRGEELSAPRETPEGFLEVEGFVSRPGIYEYINTREDEAEGLGPVGTVRRELRPDSELTSPTSLASYQTKSITVGHPRKKDGKRTRVDATNFRDFEVGQVSGPARPVGGRLAAKLLIKDKKAIEAVKAGKQQLSPGHFVDLLVEKGVDPKYGRYDAIQTEIEINHLALVEKARGGDGLRLRLDGEELREDDMGGKLTTAVDGHAHLVRFTDYDGQPCSSGSTSWAVSAGSEQPHEHAWVKNADGSVTIAESAGHTHEIKQDAFLAGLLNPANPVAPYRTDGSHSFRSDSMAENKTAREDELSEKVQQLEGEIKTLEKERDSLKGRLAERLDAAEADAVKKAVARADEAEKRLDAYKAGFNTAVKQWTDLTVVARSVLGDTYRTDNKDEGDVVRDVVKRLDPTIDTVNTPLPELRGHFKQLVARDVRAKREYHDAADVLAGGTRSDADNRAQKQKLNDDWNNQWKKPLGQTER